MGATWSDFFPPAPTLTEKNLPSQRNRVFIVTGGYSGVGFALSKILYEAGGVVYIAGRSDKQAQDAIAKITSEYSAVAAAAGDEFRGQLHFLKFDLSDLATIKSAADAFLSKEARLDVLFNNAGVSNPPQGSVSKQGHELQLATNCLGHYLFTKLLLPTLGRTTRLAPTVGDESTSSYVRVVWTSSIAVGVQAPSSDKATLETFTIPASNPQMNYTLSKTGNWFLAAAMTRGTQASITQEARDCQQEDLERVLHVTINPGNLKSNLTRHFPRIVPFLVAPLLHPPRFGAYTALWAAFSLELKQEHGGGYIAPWGRLHTPRVDLLPALKTREQGGTGLADDYVKFCEETTRDFA